MPRPDLTAPLTLAAWLRYDAINRLFPARVERVLEIGAGLGSLGALLAREYEYVGLEPDPLSYEVAARRIGDRGKVVNETAEGYEPGRIFDLVCAFEVLEHCEDDRAALRVWLRHLSPGGHLLLSVPFGRERFGPWDETAGHFRRYDRDDLEETLRLVGLESVETILYGFPLGTASESVRSWLVRRRETNRTEPTMEERTLASARNYQPPPWAAAGTWAAALPFRFVQRPFANGTRGSGIVARGRLP